MAQPQRKLRDVIAEQQFLESLGASVPQGAPQGEQFSAPDLTQEDYARFGIDPATGVGAGQMDLLPPDLVASILNAEDAVTGDTLGNYGKGALDAFNVGTKKMARGMGQLLDEPDGMSGLTAWEAQRNDPGSVDGNFDRNSNATGSGILNMINGGIEAVSSPLAPVIAPVFEQGMKQAGVEGGNLSDTMLGRNFIDPVSEMTGIEPQAVFDTSLNATMAAPFAKQIGRAANKGAHATLDMIDNATGMSDLFPEDLLPENRTARNLPRRFSNSMQEVFGVDPNDPGINAPWVRDPRPDWMIDEGQPQGELSPWLQDNQQYETAVRNSGGAPERPSSRMAAQSILDQIAGDPASRAAFDDLFAESNRRDQGLAPRTPELTTLDQVPSINENQGDFIPPQNEAALLREDAARGTVDETFESPNPTPWSGAYNPAARATADFRQSRSAPDWESHGIGPDDPARQAYERQHRILQEQDQQQNLTATDRDPFVPGSLAEGVQRNRARTQARADWRGNQPPPNWEAGGMAADHPFRREYEAQINALAEQDAGRVARNERNNPSGAMTSRFKDAETVLARDRESLREFMRNEGYEDTAINRMGRSFTDAMLSRMQYANNTRANLRNALIARGWPEERINRLSYNGLIDQERIVGLEGDAIRRDGHDLVDEQGVDAIREQVRPWLQSENRPRTGAFPEQAMTDEQVAGLSDNAVANAASNKQRAMLAGNKKYDEISSRNKAREERRKAAANAENKEPVTTFDTTGKPITTFPDGGVLKMNREMGGSYKHYQYSYESPHLPSKVDMSFSVDENGRADIAIGGDWEANRGILGSAVVRDIARHLKKAHGAKKFAGTRVTGVRAGKGIEQNVSFSGPGSIKPSARRRAESVRDTVTNAVKDGTKGYSRDGDVTTFSDGSTLNHITDYSYAGPYRMAIFEFKKPGMENSIEIELRINKKEGRADVSILGDNDHINAFGTGTVRNMQRYFRNEYGVKQFDGYRVTGANPKREISIRGSGAAPEKPSAKARKEAREKAKKEARQSPLSNDEFLAEAATPVEMFDAPNKGGKGRGNQGAKDGILATPNLRDLTPEEAAAAASKQPHLIQDKTGQYVGGPRGVRSRKQIAAMRKKFDEEVEKGLAGAQWYGRAREANVRNNSGKERQSLASKEQALMSAQATPDTNMNWAVQLRNDFEAGVPSSKAKTGRQAETYLQARLEKGDAAKNLQNRLGKKTGIYGEHLDPNEPFATTGTNDIWHARQFGYTNNDGSLFSRALTAQEHRFLDYETVLAAKRANERKMGGRSDWTAAEIQAAPWVSGKGASIAKKHNKSKAVKSGKKPMMTEEEGIAKAGETYPDLEDKYTASVTRESWPSQKMQMFPEWDMSQATAQERADWDAMVPHLDEGGRDPTYSQTFGLNTRPSQKGIGSFEGQNNPVTISRPLVNFEVEGGKKRVGKTSRDMLDMESAASGLMDMQDGSAWNKIITHDTTGNDRSSVSIDIGRTPTIDEMQALEAIATKYGFGLANANNGVSFLDFAGVGTSATGKRLKKGMQQEIENVVGPAKIERGRFEGGYHDLSNELLPENAGKGLATTKTMDAIDAAAQGAPNAKNSLLHSKDQQAKAAANLERILKTELTKGKAREDVKKLLGILAKGGWKGLYNHVQEFGTKGLPAIALPLLLMEKRERKDDLSGVDMSTY